jgi:flavin reductase (DIM6/NTAB) family NADH-FMN oxidoreductase RutF
LEKKKIETSLSNAYRFLHPMHTVLVSCADNAGKANIITLAWAMPTSINPPLVAISIKPSRHSYKLIKETHEFAVNIPTMEIVKETLFCGRRSGKNHDKFKETKLTSLPAKTIKAPIIKECVAHLECKLQQMLVTGDHIIFVGEIIEAYADEESFNEEFNIEKAKLIYHLGGNKFVSLLPKIVEPSI